jgi:hypothetical protein
MAAPSNLNVELWLSFNGSSRLALSIPRPVARATTFAVNHLRAGRLPHHLKDRSRDRRLYCSHRGPFLLFYITGQVGMPSTKIIANVLNLFRRTSPCRRRCGRQQNIGRIEFVHTSSRFQTKSNGTCVITGELAVDCAACHIIPHSKGSNVRSQNIPLRCSDFSFSNPVHVECLPSPRWNEQ